VPTALEQGINLEATVWFAIVGPAGLPRPIVDRLNKEINAYTSSADGRAKLAQFGMVETSGGPDKLGTLMDSEAAKWKQVVEAAKVSLD
ncbi:MAG: tripartite tricarboxylate transporter substrate-binding protein, partial [Variovorax sp.]